MASPKRTTPVGTRQTTSRPQSIHFSPQDVGLFIRVVAHFDPKFGRTIADSEDEIEICAGLIAKGFQPSPAIMSHLNLRKAGKGYTWTPAW